MSADERNVNARVADEIRARGLGGEDGWVVTVLDLLADRDALLARLPVAEQRAYREAQESVVNARRSANAVEGQLWIG